MVESDWLNSFKKGGNVSTREDATRNAIIVPGEMLEGRRLPTASCGGAAFRGKIKRVTIARQFITLDPDRKFRSYLILPICPLISAVTKFPYYLRRRCIHLVRDAMNHRRIG